MLVHPQRLGEGMASTGTWFDPMEGIRLVRLPGLPILRLPQEAGKAAMPSPSPGLATTDVPFAHRTAHEKRGPETAASRNNVRYGSYAAYQWLTILPRRAEKLVDRPQTQTTSLD